MRRSAAVPLTTRAPAGRRMWCRRYARWRKTLAAASRRTPDGRISSDRDASRSRSAEHGSGAARRSLHPHAGDAADTNANGDIFGGWLLSQMDIGGAIFASKIAKSRTVTVAIEAMNFRKPVYVGDLVSV